MIIFSGLIIAHAQTPSEHQLKAAFIYNFAKFVEWPSTAGDNPTLPIVIGILGNDPFGRDIDEVINGKTANGRSLIIKRFSHVRDLAHCQILFVSSSERNNLKRIFGAATPGILTVGETEQFADAGGIIQLTMINGKVHMVINQAAAERAGLKISAKLLSLARVIRN